MLARAVAIACAVAPCAGCPTVSSLRSARPVGAGRTQGGLTTAGFVQVKADGTVAAETAFAFVTDLDLYARYGATDRVDVGGSIGMGGLTADGQVTLALTEGAALAVGAMGQIKPLPWVVRGRAGASATLGHRRQVTLTGFYGGQDRLGDADPAVTMVGGGLGYSSLWLDGKRTGIGLDVERWENGDVLILLGFGWQFGGPDTR